MIWAIRLIIGMIVVGVVWDIALAAVGIKGDSFCNACRVMNQKSNGLFALCVAALYAHIFLLQFLPETWKNL